MRYSGGKRLRNDAQRVSSIVAVDQSHESLDDQLADLYILANVFGLYDAADWLNDMIGHRDRFQRDYGQPLSCKEMAS